MIGIFPGILAPTDGSKSLIWISAYGARGANTTTRHWQRWRQPSRCTFISIYLCGAGGGGGGGFTRTAGNAGGGGGGGGSGSITTGLFLASSLPEVLWFSIPTGGLGSTGSGVAGGVGGRAWCSVGQSISALDTILCSGAGDAGGGGAGNGSAGGSAGTGSIAFTLAGIASIALAVKSQNGINAAAGGGTNAAGGGLTFGSGTILLCGGTGGGGVTATDRAGGDITAGLAFPGTHSGGAAGGNNGQGGWMIRAPMAFSGGTGGGSQNNGAGGAGGNGAFGCGGGGGGAGTTGGAGGNGGDGFAIISTW